MAITFYPPLGEFESSALPQKLEVLLDSAQNYKAIILDLVAKGVDLPATGKRISPRDLTHAYNWEEIAKALTEIRELSESTAANKLQKADYLSKLAEIYEVLRSAKMPKLEAVRIALMNEAAQLRRNPQVA